MRTSITSHQLTCDQHSQPFPRLGVHLVSRKDPAETKMEVPEVVGIFWMQKMYDASCIPYDLGRYILGEEVRWMLEVFVWKSICRIYSCMGCVVFLGPCNDGNSTIANAYVQSSIVIKVIIIIIIIIIMMTVLVDALWLYDRKFGGYWFSYNKVSWDHLQALLQCLAGDAEQREESTSGKDAANNHVVSGAVEQGFVNWLQLWRLQRRHHQQFHMTSPEHRHRLMLRLVKTINCKENRFTLESTFLHWQPRPPWPPSQAAAFGGCPQIPPQVPVWTPAPPAPTAPATPVVATRPIATTPTAPTPTAPTPISPGLDTKMPFVAFRSLGLGIFRYFLGGAQGIGMINKSAIRIWEYDGRRSSITMGNVYHLMQSTRWRFSWAVRGAWTMTSLACSRSRRQPRAQGFRTIPKHSVALWENGHQPWYHGLVNWSILPIWTCRHTFEEMPKDVQNSGTMSLAEELNRDLSIGCNCDV